jgi:hypothetical protein
MNTSVRSLVVNPSSSLSDPALIIYMHWLQGHPVERCAQLLAFSELQDESTTDATDATDAKATTNLQFQSRFSRCIVTRCRTHIVILLSFKIF